MAETVIKIGHFLRTGNTVKKISVDAEIKALENATSIPTEMRSLIPRHVRVLHDHRSKRGGGHTSFDPNEMDSMVAAAVADWIVAELLRIHGKTDPKWAALLVRRLVRRPIPLVEEIDGEIVPLLPHASLREQVGLILHTRYPQRVGPASLRAWLKGPSESAIRSTLWRMERATEIHCNEEGAVLTTRGLRAVEELVRRHSEQAPIAPP